MSVVALKRLRIGGGFKEPGDRLSADELKGRNVRLMIRHGQIGDSEDRVSPSRRSRPKPDEEKPVAERSRKELDAIAAELGIENPGKLPNKEAVLAAIEERSE